MEVRTAMRGYLAAFTSHCNAQMDDAAAPRTRRALNRFAHQLWDSNMGPALDKHDRVASWFAHNSVALPVWPKDWDMPDPTVEANHPWSMVDAVIEERFGWTPN